MIKEKNRVFIVRDNDGQQAARTSSEIPGLLTDANKILWQRGYTLVQEGTISYINNSAWLDHTDVLNPGNTVLGAMFDTVNSGGNVVELYFVNELDGNPDAGVRWPSGIAVARESDGTVIAHEVLHDCGLEDIYTAEAIVNGIEQNVISGYPSLERLPLDWGSGYYPNQLTHYYLIEKLVMCSGQLDSGTASIRRIYLPRGSVYGWKHSIQGDGSSVKVLGNANVSQSDIQRSPGSF